ncbi:SMP-30/gluconolactonase/LRE family protein [Novosphingobium sp. RD2P27]|uniref:SMP-30/gluconolactonase/LRE family protein n=1 Tax=Novosphingobium kalidii TaxID=3230299 RepID=A0ABV2D1I4_9SPHN
MGKASEGGFEKLATGTYLEGLAIDHEREVIWYSDVIGGGLHGVKPDGTKVASLNPERMWTGGVLMNADGSVLSTGQGGIMWSNPETGKSGWLLDRIEGEPVNGINEMVPDGKGGLFFGTLDIEMVIAGQQTKRTQIYRLSASNELTKVAEDIGFSNGIMFDQQRRRFYCNDTFHCTWAFDVADDFTLSNRQRFLAKEDADGMALDAEGNLWVTGFRSNYFTRLAPDGTELPRYETPDGSNTQLRFGGADMCDVFFTSVPADGGDTLKEGGEIAEQNSFLLRGRSPTPGMRIEPVRFKLG